MTENMPNNIELRKGYVSQNEQTLNAKNRVRANGHLLKLSKFQKQFIKRSL